LQKKHGSPAEVVMAYVDNLEWIPWLSEKTPARFWADQSNRKRYLDWLAIRLGVTTLEDWYRVTDVDFRRHGGRGLTAFFDNSPVAVVMSTYTDFPWQVEHFNIRMKRQRRLYRTILDLFPNDVVKWNYRHPKLRFSYSGQAMELDIYLPASRLAFEYQGIQHFQSVEFFGGQHRFKEQLARDTEKRDACTRMRITLVEVPFSWDGSLEMIHKLLPNKSKVRPKVRKNCTFS
jgi:hypothetical protein